jgi:alpha-glucosidase
VSDRWWERAVFYQVYPRSFQDTNGDGIGDLEGVRRRLDHLQWLGVDAIWLTPITKSPDDDCGYDVSDFRDVHPELGTLADADRLVADAGARGIRVLFDLVPNHTSDRHPWFTDPAHEDWFVWSDSPNNWLSVFGGSAWELDPRRGRYYLHQYLPSQPDLNWWNPEVRAEFEEILRFWFDRGVAGFRVDCANRVVKDRELRDNPPVTPDMHPAAQRLGQKPLYTTDRPEVHEIYRSWRRLCREYSPERVLVAETWFFDVHRLAVYYGQDDQMQLNFNFLLTHSEFDLDVLRGVVESSEAALPRSAQPCWALSNHDVSRFTTRWCGGDERKARVAMTMLLTLRGTPFLYQGDELALADQPVPPDRLQDPLDRRLPGQGRGRDPERTPMPWSDARGAGFTAPDVEPWLPIGSGWRSAEAQWADPGSFLNFTRDLIAQRRSNPDLTGRSYQPLDSPPGTWRYRRGERTVVTLDFGSWEARIER